MSNRDQRTRERAHQLWEQEGRPEGREHEHWDRAAREIEEQEADRDSSDRGALKNDEEVPAARVGSGSGLQPGGTTPGGGPGTGMGSLGTGGGSTGGAATGSVRKHRR